MKSIRDLAIVMMAAALLCGLGTPVAHSQSTSCAIVVTTMSNTPLTGQTTFAGALSLANTAAGGFCSRITFSPSIAGGTYFPPTPITLSNVIVDGDTDGDGDADITFDGGLIPSAYSNSPMISLTGGATLTALRVLNSAVTWTGVEVRGAGNQVQRCVLTNFQTGVYVWQTTGANTIGPGNAVGYCGFNGIALNNADNVTIYENNVGNDPTGTIAWPNSQNCNSSLTACWSGLNIFAGSSNNVVYGNTISGNLSFGLRLADPGTTGNVVYSNQIGTNAIGTASLPNAMSLGATGGGYSGVSIESGAAGNQLGPSNTISGNGAFGLVIRNTGTSGNAVFGNKIGVDKLGTYSIPNGFLPGGWPNVTIRGGATLNTIGPSNVISGSSSDGIWITESGTTQNQITGNLIGTDALGNVGIPNGWGIWVGAAASGNIVGPGNTIAASLNAGLTLSANGSNTVTQNFIGTNSIGLLALPNLGGGVVVQNATAASTLGPLNVISGNGGAGVSVFNSNGILVIGNTIGLSAAGSRLPNTDDGIRISGSSSGNRIGGLSASGNVIAGNGGDGIELAGTGVTLTVIGGNYIGASAAGASVATGNGRNGVYIDQSAQNTIGYVTAQASDGNVIAYNGHNGVRVVSALRNRVTRNAIHRNANKGIDFYYPNALNQPFSLPGVTSVTATMVVGRCYAPPGSIVEAYATSTPQDGVIEDADLFLGSAPIAGNAFSVPLLLTPPANATIHVTVTDANGTTSAFGEDLYVEYIYRNSVGTDVLPGFVDHCAIALPSDYSAMTSIVEALPATGVRVASLTGFLLATAAPLSKNFSVFRFGQSAATATASVGIFDWVLNNPLYPTGSAVGASYSIFPGTQKGLLTYSSVGLLERAAEASGTDIIPLDQEAMTNNLLLPSIQLHHLVSGIKTERLRQSSLADAVFAVEASFSRLVGPGLVATSDGSTAAPTGALSQLIAVVKNTGTVAADVVSVSLPGASIVGVYVFASGALTTASNSAGVWTTSISTAVAVGDLVLVDVFFSTPIASSDVAIALDSAANPGTGVLIEATVSPEIRTGEELRVPEEFDTITAAIAAATTDSTISVAGGLYLENPIISGKVLAISRRTGGARPVVSPPAGAAASAPAFSIVGIAAGGSSLNGIVVDGGGLTSGIRVSQCDVSLEGIEIRNTVGSDGCALDVAGSQAMTLRSCLIHHAVCSGAGVINFSNSNVSATNLTVGRNIAAAGGVPTIEVRDCPVANFSNCILGDDPTATDTRIVGQGSGLVVTNCLTNPPFSGANNRSGDPRFVNSSGGDFRLAADSPCIDAGLPTSGQRDVLGGDRIVSQEVDQGAVEYDGWIGLEGTSEDLVSRVDVNGVPTRGSGIEIHPGDQLGLRLVSPAGGFVGEVSLIAVQLFDNYIPVGSAAVPEIHLDANATIIVAGPTYLPTPALGVSAPIPPSVVGFDLRVQGAAFGGSAANQYVAVSNAVDVLIR